MHFLDGCTEGLSDFRTEMSTWYSLTSIPILVSSVSLSLSNFWVSWSSNYTLNSEKEPPTQSIPIFSLNSLSCKVKSKEGNGMSWCEKLWKFTGHWNNKSHAPDTTWCYNAYLLTSDLNRELWKYLPMYL